MIALEVIISTCMILRIYHAAKSLQSCPTLCDPMDSSPPGSSVHGILQARILEWAAISFSRIYHKYSKIEYVFTRKNFCPKKIVIYWEELMKVVMIGAF